MMNLKKEKKGISLIVLIVVIAVMIILLTVIIASVSNVSNNAKLSAFASDLSIVEDVTKSFYMQNNIFPTPAGQSNALSQGELLNIVGISNEDLFIEELTLNNDYEENNDLGEYYIIDLTKLDVSSSKRGIKNSNDNTDVYAIAYPSMNVYYLKGLKVNRNTYFSLSSKLTNKVNIQQEMAYSDNNSTSVQSVEGLTVKKIYKNWTNVLGLNVEAYCDGEEEIEVEVRAVSRKITLDLEDGYNGFNFNSLQDIGFINSDLVAFNTLNPSDRVITFKKYYAGDYVGKIEVDISNYDNNEPSYTINASDVGYFEEYNTATFNVSDRASGVKEVRYEYLTKFDENGNVANYFANTSEFENEYLLSKGKRAIPDKNGNITVKIDKDVQGIQLIVIDKAGNILRENGIGQLLKIGLYNGLNDIYIGLDLKENTDNKFLYNTVLSNRNGISKLEVQASVDGVNYTEIKTINVNSTSSENPKLVLDNYENLGKVKKLKIAAYDTGSISFTRIFKVEELSHLQIGKITPETKTYNLKTNGTYYNPIVPAGFAPINEGEAIWGSADGWTKGLVIQDENGNQFVWIPVDNIEKYAKDTNYNSSTGDMDFNSFDSVSLPSGIASESTDVQNNGGFYIGRYEAGTPDGTSSTNLNNTTRVPICKKNVVAWTKISFNNAKLNAENMIKNSIVQTGLVTGTDWDTTVKWLLENGAVDSVTDNRKYGNYRESEAPANVNGYGNLQNTGFSESWKINNIYDIAGNAYEYTNEILSNCCITRGGAYSNAMPYSCLALRNRYIYGLTNSSFNMGFRIRLYIK